jgi:hypothetical protein
MSGRGQQQLTLFAAQAATSVKRSPMQSVIAQLEEKRAAIEQTLEILKGLA